MEEVLHDRLRLIYLFCNFFMYLIIDLNWFQWKSKKDWFFKDKIDFILSKLQNSAPDLSSEWHFPVQLIVDKLITFGSGMLFYVWVQSCLIAPKQYLICLLRKCTKKANLVIQSVYTGAYHSDRLLVYTGAYQAPGIYQIGYAAPYRSYRSFQMTELSEAHLNKTLDKFTFFVKTKVVALPNNSALLFFAF